MVFAFIPDFRVSASSVTEIDVSSGPVSIALPGDYKLTGSTSTNNVTVTNTGGEVNLEFDNLSITKTGGDSNALVIQNPNTNITLTGHSELSGNAWGAGLYVSAGAGVTIDGTGSITVTGGYCGAGIGSPDQTNHGNITISGGTIETTGGLQGAGIGGGYMGTGGDITIYGGNITATSGGGGAAGIGGGNSADAKNITIHSGTVTAIGKNGGAGIGSGYSFPTSKANITINGGTVNATGVLKQQA